jgi:hypothetical protein
VRFVRCCSRCVTAITTRAVFLVELSVGNKRVGGHVRFTSRAVAKLMGMTVQPFERSE